MNNGATQVAYYGGMGMPTIVILGGSNHAVLGTPYIGFVTSDTTTMSNDIHTFFATQASIEKLEFKELKIYPNPANESLMLDLSTLGVHESTIEVCDLTGRIVYSNNTNNLLTFQLNTCKFANGQYIVSVKNDSVIFKTKFEVIH